MIAKISSGKDTAGLIRYLFDTKKAKDHIDPHLVASWDGFAPDPGRTDDFTATKRLLVADLDLRVKQARRLGRAPERHVWHCSIRAATTDRHLSDAEWADIARRVVAAVGIAPQDDPDGCRWVAVRHAPDHIHIAATKVRGDLSTARHWNDYLTADRELAAMEKEYGLFQVARGDRTAAKRPTRAEQEKAHRQGQDKPARERLRTIVRTAVAATTSTDEFIRLLSHTDGVLVEIVYFPSGDVRGYKVASEDTTTAGRQPIWFSGSELAPDLSFPKIRARLEATDPQPTNRPGRRRPNPWHQATAAAERIPHHLTGHDDRASQAHLAAFGEALDALPLLAPAPIRAQLREAASAFERATRSRVQAEHHHARALRSAARAMLREPTPTDGTALAMLLDAAILVTVAASRWHQLRHRDQQVTAAQQTLLHLQAAYDEAAGAPLTALIQHRPSQQAVNRYMRHIRRALPEHAEQVLSDPAVDALTAALAEAEALGHDPERLLKQAVDQRALNDARSPARTLTWRTQRLIARPAPSDRAEQDRSTVQAERSPRPNPSGHEASAVAPPRPPQARRR
ncbi:mobilization protein [Streptomyces sp. Vc74B-19]|uniref:relaxase/mobilization nuclease domain-containing protein n=1 Tax=Streptomyces TaxID=1883 RepID=UPI001BFBFD61|nr:relaxase/mobilization nuclease domain-containing protein [Streptomyces sp. Vc74B-19]MBT3165618.1 mobilization protein [Streptomyces sp. Vc74B-19]